MYSFVWLPCLLVALSVINGCGISTKKVKSVKKVSDQSVENTALVSFFEAQHADLFFPFSCQAASLQMQELNGADVYTITLKVKSSASDTRASYKHHMQMYGWRTVIETDTQLLFEKPHTRCMVTLLPNKKELLEIILVYANLTQDDQYNL